MTQNGNPANVEDLTARLSPLVKLGRHADAQTYGVGISCARTGCDELARGLVIHATYLIGGQKHIAVYHTPRCAAESTAERVASAGGRFGPNDQVEYHPVHISYTNN